MRAAKCAPFKQAIIVQNIIGNLSRYSGMIDGVDVKTNSAAKIEGRPWKRRKENLLVTRVLPNFNSILVRTEESSSKVSP